MESIKEITRVCMIIEDKEYDPIPEDYSPYLVYRLLLSGRKHFDEIPEKYRTIETVLYYLRRETKKMIRTKMVYYSPSIFNIFQEFVEELPDILNIDEVLCKGVFLSGSLLGLLPPGKRTNALCSIAVYSLPDAILYVPDYVISFGLCKLAVNGNSFFGLIATLGRANYIDDVAGRFLRYIEFPTYTSTFLTRRQVKYLVHRGLKTSPGQTGHVPENLLDQQICDYVMEPANQKTTFHNMMCTIGQIPVKFHTQRMYEIGLEHDPIAVNHIPQWEWITKKDVLVPALIRGINAAQVRLSDEFARRGNESIQHFVDIVEMMTRIFHRFVPKDMVNMTDWRLHSLNDSSLFEQNFWVELVVDTNNSCHCNSE